MKRIISFLIAATMIVGVAVFAVSCGEEITPSPSSEQTSTVNTDGTTGTEATVATTEATVEGTTASSQSETTQQVPTETTSDGGADANDDGYSKPNKFLDIDFGGRTFMFVTTSDWSDGLGGFNTEREIAVESRTGGTMVDTAVFDRNTVMKKLYNCEIKAHEGSLDLIVNDVIAGTNEYDFGGAQYLWYNGNKNGNYLNLYDLDLDMSIEGWNKALFDQVTVRDKNGKDKLYTLDADFNLSTFKCAWIVFCNLDIYKQNFTENIFDIVQNREWTVDKMMEMIAAVSQDNGDQVWTMGDDVFGLATTGHNSIGLIMSMGIRTVTIDENHNFSTSVEQILANNAIEAVTKAGELCTMGGVFIGSYVTDHEQFNAGRVLFMGEVLNTIQIMTDIDVNYTILPEPLYSSETQSEYKGYVNNKGTTYVISKNACGGDKQMISDFFNTFVYHSHKIVYPAFITAYSQIYCSDERSAEMFEIVTQGIEYDLSYYRGNVMGLIQKMMETGKNDLNRAANTFKQSLQKQIDALIDNMTESV